MKIIKQFACAVAVVTALTVGLAACSTGSSTSNTSVAKGGGGLPEVATGADVIKATLATLKGKKVRFVQLQTAAPLQQVWTKRMQLGFAENGVKFDYVASEFDNQVLATQVQTAINDKVDALIVHNYDASGLASLIKKAQAAGIYVMQINIASNQQSDAYVGPNWDSLGATIANRAIVDCKAKGKTEMGLITGFAADVPSVLFLDGAKRAMKAGGMKAVVTQPGQYDPSKAGDIARTVLRQNPNTCAFVGIYDVMMVGVAKVVQDAGKTGDVGVYTIDASEGTCKAIGDGALTAALSYTPSQMANQVVGLTLYLLQSGLKAGTARTAIFSSAVMVDKSNYNVPGACYRGENIK